METGPLAIVALSRGKRDGIEVGQVLALHRDQRSARYAQRTEPLFGRSGPSGNDRRIPYYPADLPARDSPLFKSAPPVREEDFSKLPPSVTSGHGFPYVRSCFLRPRDAGIAPVA